jgi:hypothetical protein
MTDQKPIVDPMCAAMSTASEKQTVASTWAWDAIRDKLTKDYMRSAQEETDAKFMAAIGGVVDKAVVGDDHTAVVLCRLVHKSEQFRDHGETVVALASNVAEAMKVVGRYRKSQWPLERVDVLTPQQQVEWLPAVISEPVLRLYASKLGLTVSRKADFDADPDDRSDRWTSPIPRGFYYSPVSETFHHNFDGRPVVMSFWEQWQHRSADFPGKWDVYNERQSLGCAVAATEAEAISKVMRARGVRSSSQYMLRAERR